jgi:hypothetical protein
VLAVGGGMVLADVAVLVHGLSPVFVLVGLEFDAHVHDILLKSLEQEQGFEMRAGVPALLAPRVYIVAECFLKTPVRGVGELRNLGNHFLYSFQNENHNIKITIQSKIQVKIKISNRHQEKF